MCAYEVKMAESRRMRRLSAGTLLISLILFGAVNLEAAQKLAKTSTPASITTSSLTNKTSQLQDHKSKGEPESFNVGFTGLGDMEASDALKKMNKRSLNSAEKNDKIISQSNKKNKQKSSSRGTRRNKRIIIFKGEPSGDEVDQLAQRSSHAFATRRDFDNNYNRVDAYQQQYGPAFGFATYASRPILVERRAEELVDEIPSQLNGENEVSEEEVATGLVGDYGSKISLLTMRKVPTVLTARYNRLFGDSKAINSRQNRNSNQHLASQFGTAVTSDPNSKRLLGEFEDSVPMSSQILIATPPSTMTQKQYQRAAASRQVESEALQDMNRIEAMAALNANFLPRIARANMK